MRIKINDKIYRLKEIESGVDSLMELVEEPKYKDGDFVVNEVGSILIFREEVGDSIYDHAFLARDLMLLTNPVAQSFYGIKRYATEAEKRELLDALAKAGKRWNAEKKCVEDTPEELKEGDLAIFWDDGEYTSALIRQYKRYEWLYYDQYGDWWENATKFESKEQFEKIIKGEL